MSRARIPYGAWPRGLSAALAAAYRGVSLNKFLAEVKEGLWPEPETSGGRKIWDRYRMDEAWDHRDQDEGDPLRQFPWRASKHT